MSLGSRGHVPGSPGYIDLFAGCGGLSLGLHQAGWRGLFAIERDQMAFETLAFNMLRGDASHAAFADWPDWLPRTPWDIDQLLSDPLLRRHLRTLRGSVSLVVGGPPCQGFSVGGARNGLDVRNALAERMLEVVDEVRPELVLLENVEGITRPFRSKPGAVEISVADHIASVLEAMDYAADHFVVDASRFGVPQVRRRVLIVGVSKDSAVSVASFVPALEAARIELLTRLDLPLDRPVSVWDAIHDLDGKREIVCPDSPKFMAGTYKTPRSKYATLMRAGLANREPPDSHRFSKHGGRITAMYEAAHGTQQPGRLPRGFMLSFGTKKDKKVLLDPNLPASTITTHPDEFIHCAQPRNVTIREMARLQSFPDDFHFKGRYTINGPRRRFDVARCSQVGNAVPPLLAQAIGRTLDTLRIAALETGGLVSEVS